MLSENGIKKIILCISKRVLALKCTSQVVCREIAKTISNRPYTTLEIDLAISLQYILKFIYLTIIKEVFLVNESFIALSMDQWHALQPQIHYFSLSF